MKLKLIALRDDTKPIQAIKEIRAITGLGLKDSKDIIDACRFDGRVVEFEASDTTDISRLEWLVVEAVPEPPEPSVPRSVVLDFLLDALAQIEPSAAYDILSLRSYKALREAL